MSTQHTFKKDRYARTRGASAFIDICCSQCQTHVALYQKDGPGGLIRMYADRIHAPAALAEVQHTAKSKDDMPLIRCPQCDQAIATPMVYEPEKRLAFRMIPGTFSKHKSEGLYPRPNQE